LMLKFKGAINNVISHIERSVKVIINITMRTIRMYNIQFHVKINQTDITYIMQL